MGGGGYGRSDRGSVTEWSAGRAGGLALEVTENTSGAMRFVGLVGGRGGGGGRVRVRVREGSWPELGVVGGERASRRAAAGGPRGYAGAVGTLRNLGHLTLR